MKVVVHPADGGGCGFYRMVTPARALIDTGHSVSLSYDTTYRVLTQRTIFGDRAVGLDQPISTDVVVLQRPLRRERFELVKVLQAEGVAVVVEVDDDFHCIHRLNPAWHRTGPLQNPEMNRDWLKKSCAIADLVVVSTPPLAKRYGAHGRVKVLPNCVPAWYCDLDTHHRKRDGVTVGWSGSVITHPGDLPVTKGAIGEVVRVTGASFQVIGTGAGVKDDLDLDDEPESTGWLDLPKYPKALQRVDVGIVPLNPTEFNEAKSNLKGLEFAAAGVPFVASPTGEYRKLAEAGVGWVADSPNEWRWLVEQLVRDDVQRNALAEAWRETVRENYTIEKNAWRWWEAWETARALADERMERAA